MQHISFIMDGNRRYGKKNNIPEVEAYKNGADKAIEIARCISETYQISFISFFVLSKDNNKRDLSSLEQAFVEDSMIDQLAKEFDVYFIGDLDNLSNKIKRKIELVNNKKLSVKEFKYSSKIYLMMNYSGKYDIEQTFKACENKNITDFDTIIQHSLVKNIPEIDILIRTGGRQRISNFCFFLLLYSEIYFIDKLWNEIEFNDIRNIMDHYQNNRFCLFGA